MSTKWNPKEEWRKLKLVTEAVCLYETSADWDSGYSDEQGGDKVAQKAEKEKADAEYAKLEKVKTWGDLHDIINAITHAKELKALSDRGGKTGKAAATILGYLPGGDAFVKWAQTPAALLKAKTKYKDDIKGVMSAVKSSDDSQLEKPASGFLDAFKIDDGYQKITDDKLENKFIKDFAKEIADKPKDQKIEGEDDIDINGWYEKWLSKNIGDTDETVTGAEDDTKFTDIAAVSSKVKTEPGIKQSVQRIQKAVGGTLKGFLGF